MNNVKSIKTYRCEFKSLTVLLSFPTQKRLSLQHTRTPPSFPPALLCLLHCMAEAIDKKEIVKGLEMLLFKHYQLGYIHIFLV